LVELLTIIEMVRHYYNPELLIAGVIVNRYEANTADAVIWLEELTQGAAERGKGAHLAD
jgi:chromosome partitioning protein